MPNSSNLEEITKDKSLEIKDIESFSKLAERIQTNDIGVVSRHFGVNFANVGKDKNTIEFRLSNGTIDAKTWIENINLFGGIVKASEDLAIIQSKKAEERTIEEQEMLDEFEHIKNSEISETEKLELLLAIIMPEENRDIYRQRYEVNSKLIEKEKDLKEEIDRNITKTAIIFDKNAFLEVISKVSESDKGKARERIERDINNQRDNSLSQE